MTPNRQSPAYALLAQPWLPCCAASSASAASALRWSIRPKIDPLVAVVKKDRLPTISTLRNVMRKARDHSTRQSGHGKN